MHNISSDEIIQNIKKASDKYREILLCLLQDQTTLLPPGLIDSEKINAIFIESYKKFLTEPEKFLKINFDYAQKFQELLTSTFAKITTISPPGEDRNTEENTSSDKRFKDKIWQDSIYFNFIKEFYLLSTKYVKKFNAECDLGSHLKTYANFQMDQFLNAASPTNFIFANPYVLKETIDSNWQNIVQGLDNLLNDLKNSKDIFTVPTSDNNFFKKGENIASTKGKVIFQNELAQLICYEPKSNTHKIPIFIVPPWINKYYILDLSEHNSFVKFLTDNNFQVFIISWVNPNQSHQDIDFEDYLKQGIIEPLEYIKTLGIDKVNALGYCIGGTLLACALSYLKSENLDYINSASFLTTLLDFANAGEIGVFINEASIKLIEEEMQNKGYFDGRYLSNSFSLLRSNDLIWSYFVNNYLLGKTPNAFDLLYWNADYTNLPAKMHAYYLRNMYLNNSLTKPNALSMLDTPINLGAIDVDSFFVAASADHIAPWRSVYDSALNIKANKTFCLAASGHVAGIINPPSSSKYNYKTNTKFHDNSDRWLSSSTEHPGSWWNYFLEWLSARSSERVQAINYNKLKFSEEAPGSYCKNKSKG